MAEFTYTVRTSTGATQSGTVTANDKSTAMATLRQKGLQPLLVRPAAKTGLSMNIKMPGGNKIKPKDLVIFTRQFSTMISAGVPIMRALSTLKEQSDSVPLKLALDKVSADVQGGLQLSEALAKHPKIFSEIYVNMVAAGEAGGILDLVLQRLAMQVEKDSKIKSKLKGAMTYPAVVSVVAVVAVIFLMVGVIPKLTSILIENGGELPPMTKVTIGISEFLLHQWPILLGIIIAAIIAFRQYIKRPVGKYTIDKLVLKIPIFGPIVMKVNVARFARTFSSLLGAGVSVIEALETTAGALSNSVIKQALLDATKSIKNGQSIASSLDESHLLPQIIIQMAAVGEETGQIDTVLNKVAEFYEDEVDTVIDSMASIIEPILIVGLGSVVGLIVASVLGPITALQSSVN